MSSSNQPQNEAMPTPAAQQLTQTLLPQLQGFSGNIGVSIKAMDGSMAWHYHQDEVLPVASTMKLFVLGTFLEQVELGNCTLNDPITFTPQDIIGGSGLLLDMQQNTCLSAYNMALLMMVVSDNTATNLLTDLVGGIGVVQDHMVRHGVINTKINRKMSEDPAVMATGPFAVGTTAEYVNYLVAVHAGKVLNAQSVALFDTLMQRQHYKNFVPANLPLAEDFEECWQPEGDAVSGADNTVNTTSDTGDVASDTVNPASDTATNDTSCEGAQEYHIINGIKGKGKLQPVYAACKTGWMTGIRCDVGYLTISGVEYAYAVLSGDCKDVRPTAQNEATKLLNACGDAFYAALCK